MANRLTNESSRYLQQHADNPVDWYPWSEEAFEKAQREDKPVFLSIGYSACHWCHVMAHESFEDPETARVLNEHFVSIKVDREERPDLDRIYMNAVQAMTGGGGWPMSVFTTPEGQPFYGGTYFPPEPRHNMPSFQQVLLSVADAWENRREELLAGGKRVTEALERREGVAGDARGSLRPETVEEAVRNLKLRFDETHGGWSGAPKFPQPMALEFLLRYHEMTGDPQALHMVTQTLEAMARGGIYDQLGGGFHRYSVDAQWLTPHFERMLFTNALLARVYLHAWQVTGEPLFRAITEETLDYVLREMTSPQGGFYASQDADTEGEEGKFYVWTPQQVRQAISGPSDQFMALYGITERGNFEGKSILTFSGTFAERQVLADARRELYEARQERAQPGRDEKVLTSWNGLMLRAFAEAALALDREDYREAAARNADFLLDELRTSEGRLHHVWKAGEAKVEGFLDDYAQLAWGLLALYEATFEPRYYAAAQELMEVVLHHFRADVGFYDTADVAQELIVRPKEIQDNAVPSGNAIAVTVLLDLARLSVEPRYAEVARESLRATQPLLGRYPLGFGQWLVALDLALASTTEVAVIGDPQRSEADDLIQVARAGYAPHRLVAAGSGETPALLADRETLGEQATAYVCRENACRPPVTDAEALRALLE
jgi:hypothetical protein